MGGKTLPNTRYIRWIIHLLLAIFLANAANKFFVGDLEYELNNGFYARIFAFVGDAPDQYRILPLLPLKAFATRLSFNYSVLLYNCIFAFLVFEASWAIMGKIRSSIKYAVIFLFALLYIYCQYTGWRPDTMGLMTVVSALVLVADRLSAGALRSVMLVVLVMALTFSRAEIALIFAIYLAIYQVKAWPLRIVLLLLPLAGQLALQGLIFPEAAYYSKKMMLWDNLRLYYILRHPATYLFAAAGLAFWQPIWQFVRETFRAYRYIWLLLGAYLVLVLVVGRLNEFRLYLPFFPLFLWMACNLKTHTSNEKTPGAV